MEQPRNQADANGIHTRLVSGAAWAILGKFLTVLIGILTSMLLTRLLPASEVGSYFLAMSVLAIFVLFGQLGLQQAVVKMIGESVGRIDSNGLRSVVRLTFRYGALGAISSALVCIFLGNTFLFSGIYAHDWGAARWPLAFLVIFLVISGLSAECFRGLHDIKRATFFGGFLTSLLFLLALTIVMFFEINAGLTEILAFLLLSCVLNLLWSLIILFRKIVFQSEIKCETDLINPGKIFNIAWPMWVTGGLLYLISQADILVLSMYRPAAEVAVYGVAAKLVLFMATPLIILNSVISSTIAELFAKNRMQELQSILRTSATVVALPVFFCFVFFLFQAENMLAYLYGDFYRTGGLIVIILSVGQLINVFTGSCGITLMMTGHQNMMMLITLVCGAITLGGALTFGSEYGATGVALAATIGITLQNIGMLLGVRRTTGMWTHFGGANVAQLRVWAATYLKMQRNNH
jgi:O-antigen/teichoic acid export membrane protein